MLRARLLPGQGYLVLDAVAEAGGPPRSVIIGQSIGAAAALRTALARPDRVAGVVLAHSLGGMRHDELTALVMLLAGEKDAVLSPATVRRAGELLPRARVDVVPGPRTPCTGIRRTCSTAPCARSWPRSTRISDSSGPWGRDRRRRGRR